MGVPDGILERCPEDEAQHPGPSPRSDDARHRQRTFVSHWVEAKLYLATYCRVSYARARVPASSGTGCDGISQRARLLAIACIASTANTAHTVCLAAGPAGSCAREPSHIAAPISALRALDSRRGDRRTQGSAAICGAEASGRTGCGASCRSATE